MPKLDLDAAKKRCEEAKLETPVNGEYPKGDVVICTDLPAALAECEWSREMVGRGRIFVAACALDSSEAKNHNRLGCPGKARCVVCAARVLLRDLEKGPSDVA